MKKVFSIVLLLASTAAFAWDNPDISADRNKEQNYKSRFGTEYEYDLSRPADRIRYQTDPAAQVRDSIDTNPRRQIERDLGEYGGGVRR
jgi:hypothetical protein